MTISHSVPTESNLEQLEHYNPVFEQYDPLITAYDWRWEELFTKPLSQIEGMAYGVREDFLKHAHYRFRGGKPFAGNQCPDPASARVCFWSLADTGYVLGQ